MWEGVRGRLDGTSTGTIGFFSFFSFFPFLSFSFLFFGGGALHPPSGPGPPHKICGRLWGGGWLEPPQVPSGSFLSFLFFFFGGGGGHYIPPQWARASLCTRFLDHMTWLTVDWFISHFLLVMAVSSSSLLKKQLVINGRHVCGDTKLIFDASILYTTLIH